LIAGFLVRKVLKGGSLSLAQSSLLGAAGFLAGYFLYTYLVPSSGNEAYAFSFVLSAAAVAAANLLTGNADSGRGPQA